MTSTSSGPGPGLEGCGWPTGLLPSLHTARNGPPRVPTHFFRNPTQLAVDLRQPPPPCWQLIQLQSPGARCSTRPPLTLPPVLAPTVVGIAAAGVMQLYAYSGQSLPRRRRRRRRRAVHGRRLLARRARGYETAIERRWDGSAHLAKLTIRRVTDNLALSPLLTVKPSPWEEATLGGLHTVSPPLIDSPDVLQAGPRQASWTLGPQAPSQSTHKAP